ncbi:MAG: RNA polymerase sigma factor [Clostridiales bacterium]|nr:RNA polymerase sigma factor [Clostridiales bacterium]
MIGIPDGCEDSYRRYLKGDRSAAGEIMEKLFFGLVYYIDRYVHDVHSAEDIAMDVMSDLFVGRRGYDFRVKLKTYLYMRGRSKALDLLRHRRAVKLTGLEEADNAADERADLERKALVTERRKAVRDAVDALPEAMREAVYLVYFEELSYEEAAKVLKKNKKQVDNLLYRAKKELRAVLGDDGYEGTE